MILPMFPLAVSFFTVMTLPSAAAISLEGRHLELIKSFPLKVTTILGAKCAMALLVTLPPTLLSSAILCYSLKLPWDITVASLVIPALYSVFISAAGLLINLRFPRFDWTSEAQVVKQSASMGITIGVGLVAVGVPFVLISMNPADALAVLWCFAAVLAVLTVAVWAVLTLWGPKRFQTLTLN